MIGIVMIVAIGALFADKRRKWHYVSVATVGLLFTALLWDGITLDALWNGVTGAFSGLCRSTRSESISVMLPSEQQPRRMGNSKCGYSVSRG